MDGFRKNLSYAARMLYRRPTFSLAVILMLVLGIGINVGLFTVVNSVLFEPLPYQEPERLFSVWVFSPQTQSKFPELPVRARDFNLWKKFNASFTDIAVLAPMAVNLTGTGDPEHLGGAKISANFFDVLGMHPELGRSFLPEEDQPGNDRVVLVTHQFWVERLGANRNILNQTITLDGQNYTVVGVMPADLLFPRGKQLNPYLPLPDHIDVWKPIAFTPEQLQARGSFNYGVIGRLKQGQTVASAQEQLNGILADQAKELAGHFQVKLDSLKESFVSKMRTNILMLLGAGIVLFILGCINLANLMITHINGRRREFATRRALGGSSRNIAAQIITESMLLAFLAGTAGIFSSAWITQLLLAMAPVDLPRAQSVHLNLTVILFAFLISLVAGIIIGAIPTVRILSENLSYADLKDAGRTSEPKARILQRGLVIAEIAGSASLLLAAGLLLRSFEKIINVDAGFNAEHVLTAELSLPPSTYSLERRIAFFRDLTNQLAGLPGVNSAGAISHLPLSPESDTSAITVPDQPVNDFERPIATFRGITPGYFVTMDIGLRAGRMLNQADIDDAGTNGAVMNTVISESLAQRLWRNVPFESIVGRSFRAKNREMRIMGVVGEVKNGGLDHDPLPQVYIPPQYTETGAQQMTVVLRTQSDAQTLTPAIREEIWKLDRNLPVGSIKTMKDIVSTSLMQRRFAMTLVLTFAVLALALAVVGTYGVLSYAVSQTTQELGIRIAVGAQRSSIILHVLKRGFQPAFVGLLLGLLLGLISGKVLNNFLFGVTVLDPVTLVVVSCVLLGSATLASFVPAWRAARIDPAAALRAE